MNGLVETPNFKELTFRQGDVFIVDDKDIESNGTFVFISLYPLTHISTRRGN